ncbi:TRAM domain-containing protein [bacterium]|nr:TRAM domain-containing protein [bacterium]
MSNQNIETVTITDFSSQGLGVGRRSSGQVAMIAFAVPGDQVEVDFEFAKSKGIAFGKLVSIVSPSEDRTAHPCPYYSEGCRGCLLGAYDYQNGLIWKRNHLQNTLERIGKIESPEVRDVIPSPLEWTYRDRLEFNLQIKQGRMQIGFTGEDGIIPVKCCSLGVKSIQDSLQKMWNVMPILKSGAKKDFRMLLRDNGLGKAVAVLFVEPESIDKYRIITQLFENSDLAGWEIRQVEDLNFRFFSSRLIERVGEASIYVNIGRDSMELPLLSFTQTNTSASELLRKLVVDLIPDGQNLLDFYGGYGAFALEYVTLKSGKAVVLETSHQMVKAGRKFADITKLPIRYIRTDLNYPVSINKSHGQFDYAILDPPRDGLHKNVIGYLNDEGPGQVIYVSCHTAALARDLKELKNYTPEYFIPVDMFPNTSRLETVAVLRRTVLPS